MVIIAPGVVAAGGGDDAWLGREATLEISLAQGARSRAVAFCVLTGRWESGFAGNPPSLQDGLQLVPFTSHPVAG